MMCFQGCLSEIGLVNIYHHFPGFGGDGFMTTLLGQGCTATNINRNIFVLCMWLKERLAWPVRTSKRYIKKILTLNNYFGNFKPLF
jgi:hypothetical protein